MDSANNAAGATSSGAVFDDVKNDAEKNIFELLGAEDISEEEKAALLTQMLDLIDTRVLDRVLEDLSEEERIELERISKEDNTEAFEKFIEEKVPNYEALYVEEAKKLRQQLVIDMEK